MEKDTGADGRGFTEHAADAALSQEAAPSQTERILAAIAQGAFFVVGLGYFLVPFVLWIIMRRKSVFVAQHAKQAWLSQCFVLLSFALSCILGVLLDNSNIAVVLCFLVGIPWFFGAVYAVVKALMGERWHFPGLGWASA